ncbi:ABC transporter ATP-binding protein [Microbacterium sp. UBA3486]|uniref:ABC transporter ATP-binding protein n=1 Tax=Microbacterium TaxID=33882 RepID=UPI0025DBD41A|nr:MULTISPECIES: ABC transporter ATP-binding protein [Microbacterium]
MSPVADAAAEGVTVRAAYSDRLLAAPSRRGVVRAALRFARPHSFLLMSAIVFGVGASLAATLAPVVVGRVTDALLRGERETALLLAGVGVGLALLQLVLSAVGRSRLARGGEFLVRDVRDRIAAQLTTVPLRFVERHRHGELLQRGTAEIAALSAFVRESSTALLVTGSTVLLLVTVLALQSWVLALVLVLVFLPPALFVMHRFRSRAADAYGAEAAAEADVVAELAESVRARSLIAGAPAVTRRRLDDRSAEINAHAVEAQMRTVVLGRWISAMSLIEGATLAALIVVGVPLVGAGTVSVGVVVTFLLASVTLFSGFSDLVALVGAVEEAATGAARANDLLRATASDPPIESTPGESLSDESAKDGGEVPGVGIEVDDVWFDYGGDPVLRGVSLRLASGVRHGLAGRSGAGKSTLALILAGLYAPTRGTVRCEGVDLDALTPAERALRVAFVPQEVQLGTGTIADELRLTDASADEGDLRAAFAALGLTSWLDGLPEGLATAVGADSPLSAGQRQLVGLARIALLESRVIVLDEATSDVDPETAGLVEAALDRLAQGRTVVVVAHRESTLARLDRVLEVHEGTVTG